MVSTRPLVGLRTRLLPSFVYPSFARACFLLFAFLPHLSRPTRRLARSLARARERVVRANRTSRTRRRGHGALCLSSARNLLRSLVKRTCPGRKKTESYEEERCQDVRCNGRFPPRVRHVNSIYRVCILFVTREKLSSLLCILRIFSFLT